MGLAALTAAQEAKRVRFEASVVEILESIRRGLRRLAMGRGLRAWQDLPRRRLFHRELARIGATAVCEVEGGPEYDVALGAEAAAIKYTLDTSLVNIGSTPFDRAVDRDVTLSNSGKVTFPFEVRWCRLNTSG